MCCCGGRNLQNFLKLYESSLNSRGKGPTNKSKEEDEFGCLSRDEK
jgi:hypothetical protein